MIAIAENVAASPCPPAGSPDHGQANPSEESVLLKASTLGSKLLQRSSTAAYEKDLRLFLAWGGHIPSSAAALQKYVRALSGKTAPATMYRRLQAIRHAHVSQGLASPTHDPAMRPVLRSLQLGYPIGNASSKTLASALKRREPKSAKPLTRSLLIRVMDAVHRSSLDRRDRALLLLGFMTALKRAELVSLNVSDVRFTADAAIVTLKNRQLAVPATGGELCAVAATKDWIAHAALDLEQPPGPLFRRFDRGGDPTPDRLDSAWVSVVVKHRLRAVGIDPAQFSAQSLRRGRLAEAAKGVL